MRILSTFVLATCLISPFAMADGHSDKPSISATRSFNFAAEVTAIDHATREVTLAGADGQEVTFTVSDQVRNLPQVEAGDLVLAEVYEEVNITVHANPDGLEPGAGEVTAMDRAEEGALPGGVAVDTVMISAIVEDIDLEANTFKLRGPRGNIKQFTARDPDNLRRAAVGDIVLITITQAVGIMVERPAAE